MGCNLVDDEIDSAVFADDFEHTTCHHGDDNEFAHADNAVAHGRKPAKEVVASGCAQKMTAYADGAAE